jgi:hypothetical protein
LRDGPQLNRAVFKPEVHSRIQFYASGQPQDVLHTNQSVEVQRNSTRSKPVHRNELERRAVAQT